MCQREYLRSARHVFLVGGVLLCVALAWQCATADDFFVPPGGIGMWNDPANWSAGRLPQGNETAYIHAGREGTIDIVNPSPFTNLRIADFDAAAVDGVLNIVPGAGLDITGQILLAAGGNEPVYGVINQSGGMVNIGDAIFLAYEPSHSADYLLSDGAVTIGNNLWFRCGNATLTQTGGSMSAGQLVLAEGGAPDTASLYDLQGGEFTVSGVANIGKAPGEGDPFANSNGSMNISGGVATFGELLFGTDPTDVINISGAGILRVNQAAYSEADALADIAGGKITGAGLVVSTVDVGNGPYTQVSVVPEPGTLALAAALFAAVLLGKRSTRK
jgi:hypothetical protein